MESYNHTEHAKTRYNCNLWRKTREISPSGIQRENWRERRSTRGTTRRAIKWINMLSNDKI